MLTANYYSLLTYLASLAGSALTSCKIRTTGGSVQSLFNIASQSPSTSMARYANEYNNVNLLPLYVSTGMSEMSLCFGTSREPETFNDYKVTSLLQSMTYSIGGVTAVYDNETKKYTVTRRYIINNTSGTEQTITEYGIFGAYQVSSSNSSACLIYRELLSEPFTIAVNETVNFDLTLTYDLPAEYVPNA